MSELFYTNEEVTLDAFDFEILNRSSSSTPGFAPLPRTWGRMARRAASRRAERQNAGSSEFVGKLSSTELLLCEERRLGATLESQLR